MPRPVADAKIVRKPKLRARARALAPKKAASAKGSPGKAERMVVVSRAKFEAVMRAAESSGLLTNKGSRIGGRVSSALIEQAKRQTGIEGDTDLIEFALANVALTDDFAKVFKKARGKVDPALKLGF